MLALIMMLKSSTMGGTGEEEEGCKLNESIRTTRRSIEPEGISLKGEQSVSWEWKSKIHRIISHIAPTQKSSNQRHFIGA